MEVVGSWKLEHFCEINIRFYGGGFIETNSVQNALPCKRTFNKDFCENKQATNIFLGYR
jgi:hypothetical protein